MIVYSNEKWTPPAGTEDYYALKAPADLESSVWPVVGQVLGYGEDKTFGRSLLPRHPEEIRVRKQYGVRDGVVELPGGRVVYQSWGEGTKGDVVYCHGICDYGGKGARFAPLFLDQGYRFITQDNPAHGRSDGIHCLVNPDDIADALLAVIADVKHQDEASNRRPQKTFVLGFSLGGFASVLACIKAKSIENAPVISGGIFLAPMLSVSPVSRPNIVIELVGRALSLFAGPFALTDVIRGALSEDPWVEEEYLADPQTYHGKIRISTGLGCLKSIDDIGKRFSEMTTPFLVLHGTGDRVISYQSSQRLHDEAQSQDKKIILYEGFEHALIRKGRPGIPNDDDRRQQVFSDMISWINDRS